MLEPVGGDPVRDVPARSAPDRPDRRVDEGEHDVVRRTHVNRPARGSCGPSSSTSPRARSATDQANTATNTTAATGYTTPVTPKLPSGRSITVSCTANAAYARSPTGSSVHKPPIAARHAVTQPTTSTRRTGGVLPAPAAMFLAKPSKSAAGRSYMRNATRPGPRMR